MKKYIIAPLFLALCIYSSTAFCVGKKTPLVAADSIAKESQSAQASQELKASIYVSLQNPNMQWWYNLPPNSAPHISLIKKIFVNQKFSLFTFIDKAEVKDGNFDITYCIDLISQEGQRESILEPTQFKGTKPSRDVILACPDIMTATFSPKYALGKYTFEVTAKDNISGKTAKSSTYADFVKWIAPEPFVGDKLVKDYISGFYLQPSPETLYSIFFSKDFNLEQKGAPNSLNYCYIGFLKTAFKNNHFLIDYIRKEFSGYEPADRAKIIFLMAICQEPKLDKSLLTKKEQDYQERIYAASIPDPYKGWDRVLGAAQMDMLFGEFFADGTYTPIRRVIDLLAFADEGMFAEESLEKKHKPATAEEREKFLLGALNRTAFYSLLRRADQDPLIESYCMFAVLNNDIPQQAKKEFNPLFTETADDKDSQKKSNEDPQIKESIKDKSQSPATVPAKVAHPTDAGQSSKKKIEIPKIVLPKIDGK